MIRRPPRSTLSSSSAASDVYKRQELEHARALLESARSQTGGAWKFRGRMVDQPHVKAANKLVSLYVPEEKPTPIEPGTKANLLEAGSSGKWLEELEAGQVIAHNIRRTVTETDNILFTTATMNPAALHLDYQAAEQSQFHRPLVNSMFTLALTIGISVKDLTQGTGIAQLAVKEARFLAPVFYGDTLRVESRVLSKRESKSQKDRGVVEFEHRAYNQLDTLVCVAVRAMMMARRHAQPSRL
eukprot:TRINITY_DN18538_c0_g1_i2.p1 TRINITY_DN18538_c0_g1~~TRINITY_DN18538_c0_g1_i2.p1  ORF type:complete len:242 (-),score=53.91 TRINITY_DN18538_c0_g1_i2:446-1171(-)